MAVDKRHHQLHDLLNKMSKTKDQEATKEHLKNVDSIYSSVYNDPVNYKNETPQPNDLPTAPPTNPDNFSMPGQPPPYTHRGGIFIHQPFVGPPAPAFIKPNTK